MNPERIWIVLIVLALILLLSNALMFAVVRGWMKGGIKWLPKNGQGLDFFKQQKDAQELSEQMRKLREEKKE
jgi:hypothetical protein